MKKVIQVLAVFFVASCGTNIGHEDVIVSGDADYSIIVNAGSSSSKLVFKDSSSSVVISQPLMGYSHKLDVLSLDVAVQNDIKVVMTSLQRRFEYASRNVGTVSPSVTPFVVKGVPALATFIREYRFDLSN